MPFVTIQWGEDPRDQPVEEYRFDTIAERRAFLRGIEAGHGWGDWAVLDMGDDGEAES